MSGLFEFDDVDPAGLAAEYGTPVFVISRRVLQNRLARYRDAFQSRWDGARFFYSAKANANPWVVREALDAGWGVDACSLGDLMVADDCGAPKTAITFAGVGADSATLTSAFDRAAFVNLQTPTQVDLVSKTGASVGLRIASAHSGSGFDYATPKFGLSGAELSDAADRLRSKGVTVKGIHCHCASSVTSAEELGTRLRQSLKPLFTGLSNQLRNDLEYVNIGGGPGVSFDDAGGGLSVEILAKAVSVLMAELSEHFGHRLNLHCEPGEWVVGPAGAILMRAVGTFDRLHTRVVIADASLNQFMGTSFYNPDNTITNVTGADRTSTAHTVFGATNSPADVFCRDKTLPMVETGDLLVMHCTGAYGYVRGGRFNEHPQASEVLVDGSRAGLIRARETLADLVSHVPAAVAWEDRG